jgi:hypothetical protein
MTFGPTTPILVYLLTNEQSIIANQTDPRESHGQIGFHYHCKTIISKLHAVSRGDVSLHKTFLEFSFISIDNHNTVT